MKKSKIVLHLAAAIVAAATSAAFLPFHHLVIDTPGTIALADVLAVLFIAMQWGSGPAIVASVVGTVAFDFFFLPPYFTFSLGHDRFDDAVILVALLITSIAVGGLSSRAARRAKEAEDARQELAKVNAELLRENVERQHAQEALRQAHDELELRVLERTDELVQANKELETFSYSVSHDMRAPLRAITGFSHMLEEDYSDKLDEPARRYLARIQHAIDHMDKLIEAMFGLMRIKRHELIRNATNLSALAKEIADELLAGRPERAAQFRVADSLAADVDSELMRIILQNLIDNAWKYSSNRPLTVIEFGVQQNGDDAVYFVRDNGIGFDMAYAHKLFHPFQRLHRDDEFEGIGVGLATVDKIIKLHGGRIWVEAQPDQGATFYFTVRPSESSTRR